MIYLDFHYGPELISLLEAKNISIHYIIIMLKIYKATPIVSGQEVMMEGGLLL